jgi:predicted peptidase
MSWDLDHHGDLPYRLHLPANYSPATTRYPLVVYLHGSGERGTDTTSHLKNGVDTLESWPVIAIAPQCPPTDTFGGSWYGGESLTQKKVISLIRDLATRRSVDADRISLIGYSMGAIGLWDILLRARELFCAGVPIAGDLVPETALALKGFPIWAFHGELDKLVSNVASRKVAELMSIRYTEFAGVGHDAWRGAFAHPDLQRWLLAQRR